MAMEIYASDLNEEKQKELCAFLGIKNVDDENYDLTPIAYLEEPEKDN